MCVAKKPKRHAANSRHRGADGGKGVGHKRRREKGEKGGGAPWDQGFNLNNVATCVPRSASDDPSAFRSAGVAEGHGEGHSSAKKPTTTSASATAANDSEAHRRAALASILAECRDCVPAPRPLGSVGGGGGWSNRSDQPV